MQETYVRPTVALCSFALLAASIVNGASASTPSDFAGAIRANDLAALLKLASIPADVNVTDKLKSTPLHYAAIYGSAEAVRILLSAGADPNARNQSAATALMYAAWSFEKTRLLVEKGAEVNCAEKDGITPLMVAAAVQGNAGTVRYLIEKGADIRAFDRFHTDALMRGVDLEILQVLLNHGADAHLANAAGFSALYSKHALQDYERVRLLLAAGADPNRVNTFAGIVKKGPIALVHMSSLMFAAPQGAGETVAALLNAGARVNEVDIRKMSPLMLSVATDHASPAVVRQLIAAGADVNAKDETGESVLTWARKFRNPEILSALVAAGAQGAEPSSAPQPKPGTRPANAGEAVRRALPLLASSGPQAFREGGCAACHHQTIQASVFAAATRESLSPDPSLRQNFLESMIAYRPQVVSSLPVLSAPPGDYDVVLAYLTAFADLKEPADEFTDLLVHYIAARQHPSGAWMNIGLARPPMEDSSISLTAMGVRALKLYGWPARQSEFDERIGRARTWLENSKPVTIYERADKISGLRAAGATVSSLSADAAVLLKLQRPDGGWPQTPYLDSDAYATGIVLHTLYTTGLASANDPSYRKGVEFLLRTQFPDGSWYVRSRAPKFQPYFQSGFPFDHDQWISSAATALAVMALAPATAAAQQATAQAQR